MHDRHSASVLHERVYAEYYARSDSLTQQCRTSVPSRAPGVNHLVRLPYRDFVTWYHYFSAELEPNSVEPDQPCIGVELSISVGSNIVDG